MANKGMKGLFVWCKRHTEGYTDVSVTNMTSSWKDGLAFCALLHRFRPDLIDFKSLSKENVLYNNQLAFEIAEKELDIAALLDADDMVNMRVPDKLSVMTYLSQYYNCFRHCNPEDNITQTDSPVVNPSTTGSPAKGFLSARRSTDESICCICGKRVHLVQRYFDNGNLYHRTCHRNDSLEKIRGKNYFIKPQEGEEALPKNLNDDKKLNQEQVHNKEPIKLANDGIKGAHSIEQSKPELSLPSFVESLGSAQVKTVNISALTPSPSQEAKTLPSVSHKNTDPLISELPKSRNKIEETKKAEVVPKPRTRTWLSQNQVPKTAPVAFPRSKEGSKTSTDYEDGTAEPGYNKSKNPFESDSGSDSDTTLSSTSSEEDETNPFACVTKKQVNKQTQKVKEEKILEKSGRSNPFGDVAVDEVKKDNEAHYETSNPFGEPNEENPIKLAETVSDASDRFNPFTSDFEADSQVPAEADAKQAKKKKRPAPVPPKIQPVFSAPQRPAYSPVKKSSPLLKPQPQENEASRKMIEINRANAKDSRSGQKIGEKPTLPHNSPIKKAAYVRSSQARQKEKVISPKARSAPGYGYPLVKRKVSIKMSEDEIANELKLLDVQLTDYETKGVKLEEMLRFNMDSNLDWSNEEDELLQEWFELVNKKNNLLREESNLVFQLQQQKLEQEHADIEFQIRKLFNKPESTKTDQDKIEEENLLQKLLKVVESRNVIINSIEEERLKEAEEDSAYEKMKRLHKNPSKKKKKNKVKKIFSKREKKDKQNPDKKAQS